MKFASLVNKEILNSSSTRLCVQFKLELSKNELNLNTDSRIRCLFVIIIRKKIDIRQILRRF